MKHFASKADAKPWEVAGVQPFVASATLRQAPERRACREHWYKHKVYPWVADVWPRPVPAPAGPKASTTHITSAHQALILGNHLNRELHATLDEVAIYDRALSRDDVEAHYAEATGIFEEPLILTDFALIDIGQGGQRVEPGATAVTDTAPTDVTAATGEVFSYLERLDYVGYFLSARQMLGVECFDPSVHQVASDAKAPGGARTGRYVNNFVFLPREEEDRLLPELRDRARRLGTRARLRATARLAYRTWSRALQAPQSR